jgi:apolipoprotein D and lipocalin family protein
MSSSPFHALRWLCSCLAACLGLSLAPQVASAQPLPTVPHVDLARYAGSWHEIARLPNWFQRSCERSRAEYISCGDGSIKTCPP